MGCDQSRVNKPPLSPLRVERIITIEPQKVNDQSGRISRGKAPLSDPYQGVQVGQIKMDTGEFQEYLEEYKDCEEHISRLEKEDPLTLYYIKKSHLESIIEAASSTQEKIENLQKGLQNGEPKSANKRKNLKKVVVEYGEKDIVSKAEQEFLTSANRLEIAITELEMLQQEKALVESEVSEYRTICTRLMGYYTRQDNIAKKLTLGVESSEETRLNKELADAEAKKIRISETYQRWKEGRSQIIDACRQFAYAIKKWREIKDNTAAKLYDSTEEVRDDLVTAMQCITNARFYIKSELPYCSKSEMAVLEKAMSYIFIDMNTAERRLHAESCYTAFHNRAVALYAWIDITIQKIVQPDVKQIYELLGHVTEKVRNVRFETIRKQFPDVTWKTTDLPSALEEMDASLSILSDPDSLNILGNLDTSQLSPPPSRNEIYGKSPKGTDYKSMFKDALGEESADEISDASLDRILSKQKDSLKKDLETGETKKNGHVNNGVFK